MTSTVPTAQIGQTSPSHTVKSSGPAAQPWVTLGASGVQPGTRHVGGDGCTTTTTSSTFGCRIGNLGVGQTRVVKVKVKANGCDTGQGTTGPGEGWSVATTSGTTTTWVAIGLTAGLAALVGLIWRWRRDTPAAADIPLTE